MDYNIFYKQGPCKPEQINGLGEWDIFISAYNNSERVSIVFDKVISTDKYWMIHPEYCFSEQDIPSNGTKVFYSNDIVTESEFIRRSFNQFWGSEKNAIEVLKEKKICIDSTGFLIPHLVYMMLYLYKKMKVSEFDIIYSEPRTYSKAEETEFSTGAIENVRFVEGFSSTIETKIDKDLLLVGIGFDQELLSEIIEEKNHATVVQIVGFPSLQPDMYQQSRLKTFGIEGIGEPRFAPANDPFTTACVISEIVESIENRKGITNLYLSPLGTKPQALGFAIYFLGDIENKRSGGILYPIRNCYSIGTTEGFTRTWSYHIEFPLS